MKSTIIVLVFVVAALFGGQILNAQTKLGFVDVDVIIQQLPEFKVIEAQLKQAQKTFEDSLRAMQTEFQQRVENYQKQQALMNPETKAQEEAQLNALRERYAAYQQSTVGQDGEYSQLQKQLLQPVREKVRAAIEKVAKDEKMTAVMETGLLVYFDKKQDITFKVLDYLNRVDK